MPRSYYLGNFVPKRYLRDSYTYDRASVRTSQELFSRLTKDQLLEITHEDARNVAHNGRRTKPTTSVEHLEMDEDSENGEVVNVGSADALWIDPQQGMLGIFTVDEDKDEGNTVQKLIDNGYFPELSLSHYHATLEPKEVSVCKKGAREGTWIRKISEQEYNQLRAAQQSSSDPLLIRASRSSMQQAQAQAQIQAQLQSLLSQAPPTAPLAQALAQTPPQPGAIPPPIGNLPVGGVQQQPAQQQQQQQAPLGAQQQQQQQQDAPVAADSLVSAVYKVSHKRPNLNAAEMEALANASAELAELKKKGKVAQSQQLKVLSKGLSQLLASISGDPEMDKQDANIADALENNNHEKLVNTIQPMLIKASQEAFNVQQLKAQAQAQIQAQQQQQFVDPRGAQIFKTFMTYYDQKTQNQDAPASTLGTLPPVQQQPIYNPVVSASVDALNGQQQVQPAQPTNQQLQQMLYSLYPQYNQQQQQQPIYNPVINASSSSIGGAAGVRPAVQQQPYYQPQTSFTRNLPYHPKYSGLLDTFGSKSWGDGFIPNQTFQNKSTLDVLGCDTHSSQPDLVAEEAAAADQMMSLGGGSGSNKRQRTDF